ncbi:MAG: FAD-binding oxidoreductase, partial [Microcystaceae cyanobacterium]
MNTVENLLGNRGDRPLEQLRILDQRWQALKQGQIPLAQVIHQETEKLGELDCDVVIAGGTLGILLATALQLQGWRVAVIERGILK